MRTNNEEKKHKGVSSRSSCPSFPNMDIHHVRSLLVLYTNQRLIIHIHIRYHACTSSFIWQKNPITPRRSNIALARSDIVLILDRHTLCL